MKPMLAGRCTKPLQLRFPLLASYKLDGVRALVIGREVVSRSLKPIPNQWVQKTFSGLPEGTDGELIFGDPTHPDAYRNTVSAVMRESGEPCEVVYHCFDNFTWPGPFESRYELLKTSITGLKSWIKGYCSILAHARMETLSDLQALEVVALEEGYEGLMVRSLNGPYKQGRSTENEGYLLKIKQFEDAEAKIIDTYEFMHNSNQAVRNKLGNLERSTAQAGQIGMSVLGGLNVIGVGGTYEGVEFSIGSGFRGATDLEGERAKLWNKRGELAGKLVKFRYFPTGGKDRPRFPVFLGFRDQIDL